MASINNLNTVYANEIYKIFSTGVSEIGDTYATITDLNNLNFSTEVTANTDAIAVLNTKQLQNFNSINAINTDLTNNYQTNTVLATNFYNKTEIDATFTNYYTSTQIDTNLSTNYQTNSQLGTNFYNKSEIDTNLSTNFQTNTQLATNYYTKTEVDGLVGAGGGYTDTEIDNLLDLRVPKSDFTDRFSTFPIIDCSAPTVIHSGLTLNNSTINISPVEGLLFSNQTGGGDKVLAEFKNATSYITLQGDKIFCNNTSDDAIKQLDLSNNNAGYKMSGKIETPTGGLVVENTADANLSFTVRNTDNYITFNNDSIDCYNSVGDTGRILNLNSNSNEYVKSHSLLIDTASNTLTGGYTLDVVDSAIVRQNLRVNENIELLDANTVLDRYTNATKVNTSLDIRTDQGSMRLVLGSASDGDTNTYLECNNNTGATVLHQATTFKDNITMEGTRATIADTNGFEFYKASNDASNVFSVANDSGKLRFRAFGIDAYNTNDTSQQLLLNTNANNAVRCNRLGIGANAGTDTFNCTGGNAYFNATCRYQQACTFNNEILIWNNSKIYRRADANDSLNLISTEEINFSLQTDRATDPTTGTIALQLNDTNGITLNRATTINQDLTLLQNLILNSGNNTLSEALVSSSYDMLLTNSDTNREIRMRIGTDYGQLRVLNAEVKVMEHLQFTHATNATSEEITVNNTDIDGKILLEVGGVQILGVENDKLNILNNLRITQETITATYEQIQFLNTDSAGEMFFYFGTATAGNEVLEISPGGVYIDGTFGYSSDFSLKENIKEISSKKCYEIIKYVKPKTFNFTHLNEEKNKINHLGFVAQDFEQVIPKEWEGIITTDNKGHKRLDYCKTAVITHGAVQELIKEHEELKDLVKTMKKEITALKGELTKLKKTMKEDK